MVAAARAPASVAHSCEVFGSPQAWEAPNEHSRSSCVFADRLGRSEGVAEVDESLRSGATTRIAEEAELLTHGQSSLAGEDPRRAPASRRRAREAGTGGVAAAAAAAVDGKHRAPVRREAGGAVEAAAAAAAGEGDDGGAYADAGAGVVADADADADAEAGEGEAGSVLALEHRALDHDGAALPPDGPATGSTDEQASAVRRSEVRPVETEGSGDRARRRDGGESGRAAVAADCWCCEVEVERRRERMMTMR